MLNLKSVALPPGRLYFTALSASWSTAWVAEVRNCSEPVRLAALSPGANPDRVAVSGGNYSGEYIAFSLPDAPAAPRSLSSQQ